MNSQDHWDCVFQSRSPYQTSWYHPHLQTSIDWITRAAPDPFASILDVGTGESTLVDDLLALGYRNLSALDIAPSAIEKSRFRLGAAAAKINWIVADITDPTAPLYIGDIWHDRAVFHFLTNPPERRAYIERLASSLNPAGHAILATFGPEGPQECSGLPTIRYSAESLARELGHGFSIQHSSIVCHQTPFGTEQQFLYCDFLCKEPYRPR